MSIQTGRWSRLWLAPLLLLVLAVTTGWAPSVVRTEHAPSVSMGHRVDDIAGVPANPPATADPHGRVARPERALPVVAETDTLAAAPVAQSVSGRNHFWVPALGISRAVYSYPCSRKTAPANLIYRWGCAGANNVYILGHAYGVMKPLHDAYTSGRLRVGMLAFYADGNGNIRSYEVTSWRLVRPTDGAWAEASQPVPSMTLQTCVGARSQWRLIVRLVAVD